MPNLTLHDLERSEVIIENGLKTFFEVGREILNIKSNNLYRLRGYDTWAAYCLGHWGWTTQHAGRLARAAMVVGQLQSEPMGSLPRSERVARELGRLPEDERYSIWLMLVEMHGDKPTAAQVRAAIDELYPTDNTSTPEASHEVESPITAIEQSGASFTDSPPSFLESLIAQVEKAWEQGQGYERACQLAAEHSEHEEVLFDFLDALIQTALTPSPQDDPSEHETPESPSDNVSGKPNDGSFKPSLVPGALANAPGGSPAPPHHPPYEESTAGGSTQTQATPTVTVEGTANRQSTGKRTSKRGQRQTTATAPPVKANPHKELETKLWDLREKIPLLLSLLTTNKRNNKKDAPAPAREDIEKTIVEFRDVTMWLLRGLRTSDDLRAAPPSLATVLAAVEANETMDPPISKEEATHYWERRGTSGWQYGTPPINPVRSLEHDLPSFIRTTRAGTATSEARYQVSKKDWQAQSRANDITTAPPRFIGEKEWNALQNAKQT